MIRGIAFLGLAGVLVTVSQSCKTPGAGNESNILAARRNALDAGNPEDANRANPAHYEGPFAVVGPWTIDPNALASAYKQVPMRNFGSIQIDKADGSRLVSRATGKPKIIRDQHYHLGNKLVGIRAIPVVDREGDPSEDPDAEYSIVNPDRNYPPVGQTADGQEVRGSEELDKFLVQTFGYTGEQANNPPLFAIIGYAHPELHRASMERPDEIGSRYLKSENGITHLGAYIGKGQTRNSPFGYHDMKWGNRGYPAIVYTVGLKGVDQYTFNRNAVATMRLINELNGGPVFPSDYKFDYYRTVNLKSTLDFYAAWLWSDFKRPGDTRPFIEILKDSETWHTYCAEHITIALNLALNVPQNERWYKEIWGAQLGAKLWAEANAKYKQITGGQSLPTVEYENFKPLWKQRGLSAPTRITKLGRGLAWSAETTADLVSNYVEQYAAWPDFNPVVSSAMVMGFAETAVKRMGITPDTFTKHAIPVMVNMVLYNAVTKDAIHLPDGQKLPITTEELFQGYKKSILDGYDKAFGQKNPPLAAAVKKAVGDALDAKKGWILQTQKLTIDEAWNAYTKANKPNLLKARDVDVHLNPDEAEAAGTRFVKYYSPPAVPQRVIAGIHESDPAVSMRAVATVFDASELRKNTAEAVCYDPSSDSDNPVACQ